MSHFTVAVFSQSEYDVDELLAPYDENVSCNSEYAEFTEDDEYDVDQKTGKRGYWSNPNAKWDWYVEGGRWSDALKLKNGGTANQARVRDCVFKPDKEEYKRALRFWEVYVEGKPIRDGESMSDFDSFWKKEYFIDQYETKENYANCQSEFDTYAFVTSDGEWFETGSMGWFGMDDATAQSRYTYRRRFAEYLKQAEDEDLFITIVDCHI